MRATSTRRRELGKLATSKSSGLRDKEIVQRLKTYRQRFTEAGKDVEELQQAQALSWRRTRGTPQANLVVGRYLCFTKGDWKKGLPLLALGSDADAQGARRAGIEIASHAAQRAGRPGRRLVGDRPGLSALADQLDQDPRRAVVSAGHRRAACRPGPEQRRETTGGIEEAAEPVARAAAGRGSLRREAGRSAPAALGRLSWRAGRNDQLDRHEAGPDPAGRVRHGLHAGGNCLGVGGGRRRTTNRRGILIAFRRRGLGIG